MQQIELGTTGVRISAIGFGGMPLSIQGRPPEDVGVQVINASIDAGVNFIDTADVYCLDDDDIGHNERLIARTLKGRSDRDQIHVATKGGLERPNRAWTRNGSPQHLREACERSLKALGSEQIFLYQLHAPDSRVPFEMSVEALAGLQREGKIRHVGLSNVTVEQITAAQKIVTIASVQNRMSPYFREAIESGVVAACDERGITFLAYSPLGGQRISRYIGKSTAITRIANARGVSNAVVMLAWGRAQGKRVVPIPAASKVENAVDSAKAGDFELTPEEISEITAEQFSIPPK